MLCRVDPSSRLGLFRMRLRNALEIEHMAIFFRTNAYFQIKTNEEMTKPDSNEFQALEEQEIEGYENAKKKRQEILQEVSLIVICLFSCHGVTSIFPRTIVPRDECL